MNTRPLPYLLVLLCALSLSCSSSKRLGRLDEVDVVWTVHDFTRHIAALNTNQGSGRRSSTVHHAAAMNYVIAQNQAAGLRPGLSSFAVPYWADRNTIQSFELNVSRTDSLLIIPGIDVAPDGRSGSNTVSLRQFVNGVPSVDAASGDLAIVIDKSTATQQTLRQIEDRNYPFVFVVGPLDYETYPTHVDSTAVVQVTANAFKRMLRTTDIGVSSILRDVQGRTFNFPSEIEASVESVFDTRVSESAIVGILPGKAPVLKQEVVIVVSIFGVGGRRGDLQTFSYTDLGIGSAALLEVGRKLAIKTAYVSEPDRSVMFVHLHKGGPNYEGVRAFFNNPLWSSSFVTTLILVGSNETESEVIQEIARRHGMQSEFIPAHIPEAFSESGFLNRPVEVRKMQEREPGRTAIDRRDLKVAMDSAAVEALRLATITFERVTDLVDVVDGDLTKPH